MVVSFIGMATQEVSIKQNVSIILKSDTKVLGEVMVVAYGTAKKESFTGSASVIMLHFSQVPYKSVYLPDIH